MENRTETKQQRNERLQDDKFQIACDVLRDTDPLKLSPEHGDWWGYRDTEYDGEAALIANCVASSASFAEAEHAIAAILHVACGTDESQARGITRALLTAWADYGLDQIRETGLLGIGETLERLQTAAEAWSSDDMEAEGIPRGHDALRYLIWIFEEDDAPKDAVAARDALCKCAAAYLL